MAVFPAYDFAGIDSSSYGDGICRIFIGGVQKFVCSIDIRAAVLCPAGRGVDFSVDVGGAGRETFGCAGKDSGYPLLLSDVFVRKRCCGNMRLFEAVDL